MDFLLSLAALILLSSVLLIIIILIRIILGSPVLFKQNRPGLNEKIFTIYKFRTMIDIKSGQLNDIDRLTIFGKFLRSTSLDELPELFNILIGDMSIVGPRPQLIKDMIFMTEKQRMRHNVLPGLTGWAQVNGRNDITWEEKLSIDLEYISKITFFGDLKIIFMTIKKVFSREGISGEGFATAEDLGDYLLRKNKISKEKYYITIQENKELIN
jgi:undecaprenyl phosphate N,N'-diacetylbacillosamine 1-phosphate transferase